jgi:ATP-dependent DNA helicase RecG
MRIARSIRRAAREALANAICHRDYTIPGAAVEVAMYDDHLEVVNPGELHFGLTPEKLVQPHESQPWNPIIANVFYRAGIIERWDEGTLNILEWCGENASPRPMWEEQADSVVMTFLPAAPFESQLESQLGSAATSPDERMLRVLTTQPLSKSQIAARLGQKQASGPLHSTVRQLLEESLIEYTIPEKPQSRLQHYRLTTQGRERIARQAGDADEGGD